jgi:hypothetical protein
MTDRLVRFASSVMERRVSRRGFLSRMALGGSALAVAPIRFLTRPLSAEQTVHCSDCSSGSLCCDGWTAFCCQVTAGNSNFCPPNTYRGGWWKCTSYRGTNLCDPQNIRYLIDCNLLPGNSCSEGCHCANNDCGQRSTCCNVFKYGQCHVEITQITPIVCRMVRCRNPCEIWPDCNCTYKQDDNTCAHEAGCL